MSCIDLRHCLNLEYVVIKQQGRHNIYLLPALRSYTEDFLLQVVRANGDVLRYAAGWHSDPEVVLTAIQKANRVRLLGVWPKFCHVFRKATILKKNRSRAWFPVVTCGHWAVTPLILRPNASLIEGEEEIQKAGRRKQSPSTVRPLMLCIMLTPS